MKLNRSRRRPDLFGLVLVLVGLGVSISVAYQVSVHHQGVVSIGTLAQVQGK